MTYNNNFSIIIIINQSGDAISQWQPKKEQPKADNSVCVCVCVTQCFIDCLSRMCSMGWRWASVHKGSHRCSIQTHTHK